VLLAALQANGFEARWVELRTTPLTTQVHVVIEVRQGGRWIAIDPGFAAFIARDGKPVGAAEVRDALYQGKTSQIAHARRPYAARDEVLIAEGARLLHKFHYPLVARQLESPVWARIPPLRFWFGPAFAIDPRLLDGHNEDVALHQALYFLIVAALPFAAVAVLAGLLAAILLRRRRGAPMDAPSPVV
jgi:hypothetical protein